MKLLRLLQAASSALHTSTREALERLFTATAPIAVKRFDHGIDPP